MEERSVRQVGHFQELYRDARSTEHKITQENHFNCGVLASIILRKAVIYIDNGVKHVDGFL
jgi:hypothetical protein